MFFAVSVDTVGMNKTFAQSIGVDFPLLSDPDRKLAEALGVASPAYPGISRWTFYIGLDGKILYIDKAVSPATHGKTIVAKLAELGIPRRKRK